jgi:peptidoglycan/xylan/chitin deacetylase (PgdA/CDA1 family)
MVGVTYDDGPDERWTPAILDRLAAHGAHATFFLLLSKAEQYPGIARRIVAGGHEIGLHGWDHEALPGRPLRSMIDELTAGRMRLEGICGSPVTLFRPPFGAQNLRSWFAARIAGLDVVVWSADAEDWIDQPAGQVARRALVRVGGGDILLLHDGLESGSRPGAQVTTFDRAQVADLVLRGLADRGLRAAGVKEMVAAHGCRRTAWFRP